MPTPQPNLSCQCWRDLANWRQNSLTLALLHGQPNTLIHEPLCADPKGADAALQASSFTLDLTPFAAPRPAP